jgi:AcrR family transcriptional regulator
LPFEAEPGLRERKKVRTRSAIQHHALRLFREQGYEATTVTQIVEAAEVSESTFFRYFGSKEAVVLEDDFDDDLFALFRAQPPELHPIQAMRRAVRAAFADITPAEMADAQQRAQLIFTVPELRAAIAGHIVGAMDQVAELLGQRMGRSGEDLSVRTLAGAVVGAMMAVTMSPGSGMVTDFVKRMDTALAQLEAALPNAR